MDFLIENDCIDEEARPKKLGKNDRFTCWKCSNTAPGRERCAECKGEGTIPSSHGLVRLIEQIIDRKKELQAETEEVFDLLPRDEQLIKTTNEPSTAVHSKYFCDGCKVGPIRGVRYSCTVCEEYDLCVGCYEKTTHPHKFRAFDKEVNPEEQLRERLKERMSKSSIPTANRNSTVFSALFR